MFRNFLPLTLAAILLSSISIPSIAFCNPGEKKLKKRVAVFVFEDKSDHTWGWWGQKSVGEGMADMLITELVNTGEFTVIERTELAQLLAEQKLAEAGVVTPETAAQAGKVLGVDLAIIGAVTEFGQAKGGSGGSLKGISLGVKKDEAIVAADIRMVNTTTGEIVAAEAIRKTESKHGIRFKTGGIRFENQSQFDQSLIGKATRDAIGEIVKLIVEKSEAIPWQGKIVKADDDEVIINAGAEIGVEIGDRFIVIAEGEELIDPDTGLSLGSEETEIGEIEVVENRIGNGKASRCKVVRGEGFARGQVVRER